jgi:hypothetical protein
MRMRDVEGFRLQWGGNNGGGVWEENAVRMGKYWLLLSLVPTGAKFIIWHRSVQDFPSQDTSCNSGVLMEVVLWTGCKIFCNRAISCTMNPGSGVWYNGLAG